MKKEEILAQVAEGKLTVDEASKLLAELEPPRTRHAVLQSQSQRRRQSLRFAADARDALCRAMGTAAGLRRSDSGVFEGARRRVETQAAIARVIAVRSPGPAAGECARSRVRQSRRGTTGAAGRSSRRRFCRAKGCRIGAR